MSHDKRTIETYDRSAKRFANHFDKYFSGAAVDTIDKAFELAGAPEKARVVEIGCGTGKEAAVIVKRAAFYEGFDPSAGLLEIAREKVPGATFIETDALSYQYPENLDVVFAFAAMLHLDKDDFAATCRKVHEALRPGGVFCMTLKEADEYKSELQTDDFGKRLFFHYNAGLVEELAGEGFKPALENHKEVEGRVTRRWLTIMLRKT
jgi:trans-aconitate methyltransferase